MVDPRSVNLAVAQDKSANYHCAGRDHYYLIPRDRYPPSYRVIGSPRPASAALEVQDAAVNEGGLTEGWDPVPQQSPTERVGYHL